MKPISKILVLCLTAMLIITSCKKDNEEPKKHILTINANPTNGGTVTGGGEYISGEEILLTANSNTDYIFVNWKKGDVVVSTESEFTYTTTEENVSLTANFAIKTYHLSLNNPFPNGSAVITGSGDYTPGTNVNITVTSGSGWAFSKWKKQTGAGLIDISIIPNFTYTTTAEDVTLSLDLINVYTLQLAANPANSGTVTGAGTYPNGTSVNLTATPSIGYIFVNWTKEGVEISTSATYQYSTTATNETITANFNEKTYSITLGAQSHATIGAFYSIAKNKIFNLTEAEADQTAIDILCFYEHDVISVPNRINDITLSSPGANILGIFSGDFTSWTTKRTTLFTLPATAITPTQFDALHQNDPAIQGYYNVTVTSGNKKAKLLTVDNIYAFKTTDNVYGLFKVTNVVNSADGSVQVILKFRK